VSTLRLNGLSGAVVRRLLTVPRDGHAGWPRPSLDRSAAVRVASFLGGANQPQARSDRKNLDAHELRAIAGADQ
jgi:hypothetical protein